MKRRRRLLRYIRSLALAGACLAVFAASAVASGGRGMPVFQRGSHSAISSSISYRAGDTPGDRTPVPATHATIAYRAGDAAVSRVPGSAIQPVSEPFVSRTVVKDDGSQTLAIILAGSALAIALSGAALVVVRLNRNPVGLH